MNTDLLKPRSQVFIPKAKVQLKLNEIKVIKNGLKVGLNLGEALIYEQLEKNSSHKFLGLSPNIYQKGLNTRQGYKAGLKRILAKVSLKTKGLLLIFM